MTSSDTLHKSHFIKKKNRTLNISGCIDEYVETVTHIHFVHKRHFNPKIRVPTFFKEQLAI